MGWRLGLGLGLGLASRGVGGAEAAAPAARIATEVELYWNPMPVWVGTRTRTYAQLGQERWREERHIVPRTISEVPVTSGHLSLLVRVTKRPVVAPAVEDTREQVRRRRPEVVADDRRTPWKKRGLLKKVSGWSGEMWKR